MSEEATKNLANQRPKIWRMMTKKFGEPTTKIFGEPTTKNLANDDQKFGEWFYNHMIRTEYGSYILGNNSMCFFMYGGVGFINNIMSQRKEEI